ncbi:ParB/RepB/Spo0J family partition protein [Streptomyces flaveus]|uniref:ParB-like N-terminal domain-containing protein n=1 Tax=Streptomyces flaveus TaxID=66370 RepID=A0A917QY92_9ACTN|nr:ParB N-terminal domain-containing protein [Streptomyces flaveus]GGK76133.1 hypothetical protein GCM10010094_41600 [Streptomyces flaveus]
MTFQTEGTTSIDVLETNQPKPSRSLTRLPSRSHFSGLAVTVPIDTLQDADSIRLSGMNHEHVNLLAENLDDLPPILVHDSSMRVIDGMHRLQAARLKNRTTVQVIYFKGTAREAFLLAVESNIKHGLPLSLEDRKESAKTILRDFPEWSDRAIAAKVGLSNKTVGSVRRNLAEPDAQPSIRVGLDGRARPMSSTEGRLKASAFIGERPDASLREIARTAGISVETARDVRKRLKQGQGPLLDQPHPEPQPRHGSAQLPCLNPWQTDLAATFDSLRRDPALKYSTAGRKLLRWLEARMIRKNDVDLMLRTPAHQVVKVAEVARVIAARWDEIAVQLETEASAGADHSEADPAGSAGEGCT